MNFLLKSSFQHISPYKSNYDYSETLNESMYKSSDNRFIEELKTSHKKIQYNIDDPGLEGMPLIDLKEEIVNENQNPSIKKCWDRITNVINGKEFSLIERKYNEKHGDTNNNYNHNGFGIGKRHMHTQSLEVKTPHAKYEYPNNVKKLHDEIKYLDGGNDVSNDKNEANTGKKLNKSMIVKKTPLSDFLINKDEHHYHVNHENDPDLLTNTNNTNNTSELRYHHLLQLGTLVYSIRRKSCHCSDCGEMSKKEKETCCMPDFRYIINHKKKLGNGSVIAQVAKVLKNLNGHNFSLPIKKHLRGSISQNTSIRDNNNNNNQLNLGMFSSKISTDITFKQNEAKSLHNITENSKKFITAVDLIKLTQQIKAARNAKLEKADSISYTPDVDSKKMIMPNMFLSQNEQSTASRITSNNNLEIETKSNVDVKDNINHTHSSSTPSSNTGINDKHQIANNKPRINCMIKKKLNKLNKAINSASIDITNKGCGSNSSGGGSGSNGSNGVGIIYQASHNTLHLATIDDESNLNHLNPNQTKSCTISPCFMNSRLKFTKENILNSKILPFFDEKIGHKTLSEDKVNQNLQQRNILDDKKRNHKDKTNFMLNILKKDLDIEKLIESKVLMTSTQGPFFENSTNNEHDYMISSTKTLYHKEPFKAKIYNKANDSIVNSISNSSNCYLAHLHNNYKSPDNNALKKFNLPKIGESDQIASKKISGSMSQSGIRQMSKSTKRLNILSSQIPQKIKSNNNTPLRNHVSFLSPPTAQKDVRTGILIKNNYYSSELKNLTKELIKIYAKRSPKSVSISKIIPSESNC